jgi:hypothetical protein
MGIKCVIVFLSDFCLKLFHSNKYLASYAQVAGGNACSSSCKYLVIIIIIWLYIPIWAWPPLMGFHNSNFLQGWIVSPAPNPQPGGPGLVFMTSRDRVAQLYPQALGTHFSRLLQQAWVTVGLFFNPGHHTGQVYLIITVQFQTKLESVNKYW